MRILASLDSSDQTLLMKTGLSLAFPECVLDVYMLIITQGAIPLMIELQAQLQACEAC